MIFNQLSKYLNTFDPIEKRGSGVSLKDLKYLAELGIVKLVKVPLKSGKLPKNENAFELTLFGRDIIRKYLNKSISKEEILNKLVHDIDIIHSELGILKDNIDQIDAKLKQTESFLQEFNNHETKGDTDYMETLSDRKLVELLHTAEQNALKSDMMGLLYKTEIYFNVLKKNTPLSDNSIEKRLYKLYEKDALDLQMGPDHGGRLVTSPSGKKFSWGNLVI